MSLIAALSPDGPPPTITTSNSITSRSIVAPPSAFFARLLNPLPGRIARNDS
jgi:hypothetical protein